MEYPDIPSTICPVPHGQDLPMPITPPTFNQETDHELSDHCNDKFIPEDKCGPQLFS